MINNNSPYIGQGWATAYYVFNQVHVSVRPFLAIFGVTDSNKRMYSFCRIYGSKDESAEAYRSYTPQKNRDKLKTEAQNSANSEVIDEYESDKDGYGVDEIDIVAGAEDKEDEDDGERQYTPPSESNNASTLQ